MKKTPYLIGVVAGTKATDELLCHSLEEAGFNLRVVHYKIPLRSWIPWMWKRVEERGLGTLIGHLCLAGWLRSERILERFRGTSIWLQRLSSIPVWRNIHSGRALCFNEEAMARDFKDVDLVIFLDSFRISHHFFRRLKKPCFQIVWGDVPDYLGDSGGYWAHARGDVVAVSLLARRAHSDILMPVYRTEVPVVSNDTLRTLKVKQAIAIHASLPDILKRLLIAPYRFVNPRVIEGSIFYAPTLRTYLFDSLPMRSFPRYAFRTRMFTLYDIDWNI